MGAPGHGLSGQKRATATGLESSTQKDTPRFSKQFLSSRACDPLRFTTGQSRTVLEIGHPLDKFIIVSYHKSILADRRAGIVCSCRYETLRT